MNFASLASSNAVLLLAGCLGAAALIWMWRRLTSRSPDSARAGRPRALDAVDTVIGWPPEATRVLTLRHQRALEVLRRAVPEHMILAQVPLSHFIKVPTRLSYVEWLRRVGHVCVDLMVCDAEQERVIGTYRLLTPAQALRAGGLYSDQEFDLAPLNELRPQMVELGRSCVHVEHRHGGVILALWGALAEFMQRNQLQAMVGCASIPMQYPGLAHGEGPARVWQQLSQSHLAEPALQVRPRVALPEALAHISSSEHAVEPPALIQGYLRTGAKVLGAPAWDSEFNTADLPIMMRMQDLPSRYQRMFLRGAERSGSTL